jgi:hypothetical protein
MILLETNYFEKAENHIELSRIFLKENWLESLNLWIDMIVYPILSLLYCVYFQEQPTIFTMISFYKTITLWSQWFEFQVLNEDIREWTNIVRSAGGPFISTNDPTYHVYVYADGMQRIIHSFQRKY